MGQIIGPAANFDILDHPTSIGAVVIRDIGPWDKHLSVTNDAEDVVERLIADGSLRPDQRLFYFDSEGDLDEIIIKDGKFAGFDPGPRS